MIERSNERNAANAALDASAPVVASDDEQDAAHAFDAMREAFSADTAKLSALIEGQVQHAKIMAATLADLAASPALKLTPQQYASDLAALRAEAVQSAKLTVAAELQAHKNLLNQRSTEIIDQRLNAKIANWRLALLWLPFAAGLILYPLLGTIMPGGNTLAAWATGNRKGWAAGSQLMESADPVSWTKLVAAWNEIERQEAAIKACRASYATSPTLVVPPGQPPCDVILPKPTRGK
jgi:hypothetical protein